MRSTDREPPRYVVSLNQSITNSFNSDIKTLSRKCFATHDVSKKCGRAVRKSLFSTKHSRGDT